MSNKAKDIYNLIRKIRDRIKTGVNNYNDEEKNYAYKCLLHLDNYLLLKSTKKQEVVKMGEGDKKNKYDMVVELENIKQKAKKISEGQAIVRSDLEQLYKDIDKFQHYYMNKTENR